MTVDINSYKTFIDYYYTQKENNETILSRNIKNKNDLIFNLNSFYLMEYLIYNNNRNSIDFYLYRFLKNYETIENSENEDFKKMYKGFLNNFPLFLSVLKEENNTAEDFLKENFSFSLIDFFSEIKTKHDSFYNMTILLSDEVKKIKTSSFISFSFYKLYYQYASLKEDDKKTVLAFFEEFYQHSKKEIQYVIKEATEKEINEKYNYYGISSSYLFLLYYMEHINEKNREKELNSLIRENLDIYENIFSNKNIEYPDLFLQRYPSPLQMITKGLFLSRLLFFSNYLTENDKKFAKMENITSLFDFSRETEYNKVKDIMKKYAIPDNIIEKELIELNEKIRKNPFLVTIPKKEFSDNNFFKDIFDKINEHNTMTHSVIFKNKINPVALVKGTDDIFSLTKEKRKLIDKMFKDSILNYSKADIEFIIHYIKNLRNAYKNKKWIEKEIEEIINSSEINEETRNFLIFLNNNKNLLLKKQQELLQQIKNNFPNMFSYNKKKNVLIEILNNIVKFKKEINKEKIDIESVIKLFNFIFVAEHIPNPIFYKLYIKETELFKEYIFIDTDQNKISYNNIQENIKNLLKLKKIDKIENDFSFFIDTLISQSILEHKYVNISALLEDTRDYKQYFKNNGNFIGFGIKGKYSFDLLSAKLFYDICKRENISYEKIKNIIKEAFSKKSVFFEKMFNLFDFVEIMIEKNPDKNKLQEIYQKNIQNIEYIENIIKEDVESIFFFRNIFLIKTNYFYLHNNLENNRKQIMNNIANFKKNLSFLLKNEKENRFLFFLSNIPFQTNFLSLPVNFFLKKHYETLKSINKMLEPFKIYKKNTEFIKENYSYLLNIFKTINYFASQDNHLYEIKNENTKKEATQYLSENRIKYYAFLFKNPVIPVNFKSFFNTIKEEMKLIEFYPNYIEFSEERFLNNLLLSTVIPSQVDIFLTEHDKAREKLNKIILKFYYESEFLKDIDDNTSALFLTKGNSNNIIKKIFFNFYFQLIENYTDIDLSNKKLEKEKYLNLLTIVQKTCPEKYFQYIVKSYTDILKKYKNVKINKKTLIKTDFNKKEILKNFNDKNNAILFGPLNYKKNYEEAMEESAHVFLTNFNPYIQTLKEMNKERKENELKKQSKNLSFISSV